MLEKFVCKKISGGSTLKTDNLLFQAYKDEDIIIFGMDVSTDLSEACKYFVN